MEKRRGSPLRRAVLFRFMRRPVGTGPGCGEGPSLGRTGLGCRCLCGAPFPCVFFRLRLLPRRLLRLFPAVFADVFPAFFSAAVCRNVFRLSFMLAVFPPGSLQRFPIVFPVCCLSAGACRIVFRLSFRPPFRASFPGGTGGNRADAVRRVGRLLRPRGKRAFRRLPAERRYSVEVGAELPGVGRAAFASAGGKGLRSAADSAVRRRTAFSAARGRNENHPCRRTGVKPYETAVPAVSPGRNRA